MCTHNYYNLSPYSFMLSQAGLGGSTLPKKRTALDRYDGLKSLTDSITDLQTHCVNLGKNDEGSQRTDELVGKAMHDVTTLEDQNENMLATLDAKDKDLSNIEVEQFRPGSDEEEVDGNTEGHDNVKLRNNSLNNFVRAAFYGLMGIEDRSELLKDPSLRGYWSFCPNFNLTFGKQKKWHKEIAKQVKDKGLGFSRAYLNEEEVAWLTIDELYPSALCSRMPEQTFITDDPGLFNTSLSLFVDWVASLVEGYTRSKEAAVGNKHQNKRRVTPLGGSFAWERPVGKLDQLRILIASTGYWATCL
ncbi:hypothetical protein JB92DRAFT_2838594 [Gautieria morchelliformis]|nr:hypothetical protein JB92DRAFT_2838594 [Gautieria morchelliformis]